MNTINQICAFMENKPGQIVGILQILSAGGINLRALNVSETEDYGVLRFIADDHEKAFALLKENGYIASKAQVAAIEVTDEPGGLEKLLATLATDGVDIAYMYSVFAFAANKAYMIIHAKDVEVLMDSLKKNGISAAGSETLGIK